MKKTILIFMLATIAIFSVACSKKEEKSESSTGDKVIFGTNAEFPPFAFVTSKDPIFDQFSGIDMEITKFIAQDNNFDAKVENMEFDALVLALNNKQVDLIIGGITITPEKKEEVDFSIPYYNATQVMIVNNNSDIKSAQDLKDKKIAVVQGYTGEVAVKKLGYEAISFKNGADAVLELSNNKCDVVVIDSATADKYIENNKDLKIVKDDSAFDKEEYGIAVPKGNKELLDKVNSSIQKILDQKLIQEWEQKYSNIE